MGLFDRPIEPEPEAPETDPIHEKLGDLSPDEMTPRQALETLYELVELVRKT